MYHTTLYPTITHQWVACHTGADREPVHGEVSITLYISSWDGDGANSTNTTTIADQNIIRNNTTYIYKLANFNFLSPFFNPYLLTPLPHISFPPPSPVSFSSLLFSVYPPFSHTQKTILIENKNKIHIFLVKVESVHPMQHFSVHYAIAIIRVIIVNLTIYKLINPNEIIIIDMYNDS